MSSPSLKSATLETRWFWVGLGGSGGVLKDIRAACGVIPRMYKDMRVYLCLIVFNDLYLKV